MTYSVSLEEAQEAFPDFTFVAALTPSAQKAAFHVRTPDGADLCLKMISPNSSPDRTQREVEALQQLTHPGVARLIQHTLTSSRGQTLHFVLEEFISGSDLTASLGPSRKWSEESARVFFGSLCDALENLRECRIVHRDLKPANIRVRSDGTPVIIDFGLARLLDKPDLTATAHGAGIGTPLYFAPEQFAGTKRDIEHRTDLFALGVIMFEALTGAHPFAAPNQTYQQLERSVCQSAAALHDVPDRLRLVVGKLLSKKPIDRPASASIVAKLLRKGTM